MQNFEFNNPAQTIFGKATIDWIERSVTAPGVKKYWVKERSIAEMEALFEAVYE